MPDDLITADSTETTTDSDGRTTVTGYQSDSSTPVEIQKH